jgi:DNA (cytosine-5)-methyltransferase 1
MTKFKLGELFCGPGGIAYGAVTARSKNTEYGIEHQWATDYDRDTCDTYAHNICPNNPDSVIHEDIRKLNLRGLRPIDALAFGFPCNDYSVVGEQKGMEGIYGPLYSFGVQVLKIYQPQWFLAENVGGLKNADAGKTFTKIIDEMREVGYTVTPHLYKFEEYGVPQARHRIIIVGIRNDIKVTFRVPSPAPYKSVDNSARTAIEKPAIQPDAPNNETTKQSATVVARLKHIKPGENAFNANLPDEWNPNWNMYGGSVYWYSALQKSGNYWRYVDGVPTPWN